MAFSLERVVNFDVIEILSEKFRLNYCFVIWRVKNHQISILKWRQKLKKSQSKKEACCEEAPEGILDGKMCDYDPGPPRGPASWMGGGMDKSIPKGCYLYFILLHKQNDPKPPSPVGWWDCCCCSSSSSSLFRPFIFLVYLISSFSSSPSSSSLFFAPFPF